MTRVGNMLVLGKVVWDTLDVWSPVPKKVIITECNRDSIIRDYGSVYFVSYIAASIAANRNYTNWNCNWKEKFLSHDEFYHEKQRVFKDAVKKYLDAGYDKDYALWTVAEDEEAWYEANKHMLDNPFRRLQLRNLSLVF